MERFLSYWFLSFQTPSFLESHLSPFLLLLSPSSDLKVVPFAMNPARKSIGGTGGGKLSPFLLLIITIISCVATYNLLSPFMQSDTDIVSSNPSTADPIVSMPGELKGSDVSGQKRLFHVALTATDAPYSKWQCRIMHYWYKQMRDREGSEMGGFTRVLHSGKPDNLMDEIPTFVVDPLPDGKDRVRISPFWSLIG